MKPSFELLIINAMLTHDRPHRGRSGRTATDTYRLYAEKPV